MSHRLRKAQRQHILREPQALARFLSAQGVPMPAVYEAVKRSRDDLVSAYRTGITPLTVERESYLAGRAPERREEEQS